ncbi:MAG: 2-C-methyl-D-erythritol 2,4-cyclodiphosphate synthase [Bacilli bacterium]
MEFRIGHSHDTHKLVKDRKLILGGIEIDYHLGLDGHSDADVVLHAVCESILGALGLGDIGTHFSDKDPKYKNMDSRYFVKEAKNLMESYGYEINNMDITIYIEKPFLRPYIGKIKLNIADILECEEDLINVKATRGEGLGFIGRGEGISSECVVLLKTIK